MIKPFVEQIRRELQGNYDQKYHDFTLPLIPNVDPATFIGVRIPVLRDMGKRYKNHPDLDEFLSDLPHAYHEENLLHAIFLSGIKDFNALTKYLEAFLPHVSNWSTCDTIIPAVFRKHQQEGLAYIDHCLASTHAYTIRFAIKMLMTYYLDDAFDLAHLEKVAKVRHEDYYVKMMQAWYFATALAKQPVATMPYIKEHRLESWVHNKTISKACDSYRISEEMKQELKLMRD